MVSVCAQRSGQNSYLSGGWQGLSLHLTLALCLLVNREVGLGRCHLRRVHGGRGDEQWRRSDSDKRRGPSKWMKETIQMSGPFFFKYTPRSGMARSFASSLFRFGGTSLLLSTVAAPVDVPTNSVQIFSTCSPTFVTTVPFG